MTDNASAEITLEQVHAEVIELREAVRKLQEQLSGLLPDDRANDVFPDPDEDE